MTTLQKIRKRNGSIADFDHVKIVSAVKKAFFEVLNDPHEADTNAIGALVSSAVRLRYAGTAQIPSVEEVQDLVERALMERGYEGDLPELPGEVAVAWPADDATAPARGVHEYAKKLKGALALLGGVFENAFLNAQGIQAIATIPPMIVLRGMFVNVINSPIQGLVMALDQISKKKQ